MEPNGTAPADRDSQCRGACPALPIYLISFFMDVVLGMGGMAFPWLAQHRFHAGAPEIGLIASIGTALYTAVALGSGRLATVVSPYRRMVLSAFIAAGAYGLAAETHSLPLFCIATWTSSTVMGAFWPALQTQLTAGCSGDEIQRRVTRFNVSWSLGFMLGPAIAGHVYGLSPAAPYLVALGVGVGVTLLIVGSLHGKTQAADETKAGTGGSVSARRERARVSLFLIAAWCAHFGSYFCAANVRNFFPVLATAQGIPHEIQGNLGLELGVFQTLSFFLMSRAHKWVQKRGTSILGLLLVAAGVLVASKATVTAFALGFGLAGLGFGVTYVVSIYYSLHSEDPSRNAGIHEGIVGGSGIFGSLGGGQIAGVFGNRSPFFLCAGVVALCMTVCGAILSRPGSRAPRVEQL